MNISLIERAKRVSKAAATWVLAGMPICSPEDHAARLRVCHAPCKLYDPKAYAGTGGCNSCGCSTEAKAWLATEPCPEGYWSTAPESQH